MTDRVSSMSEKSDVDTVNENFKEEPFKRFGMKLVPKDDGSYRLNILGEEVETIYPTAGKGHIYEEQMMKLAKPAAEKTGMELTEAYKRISKPVEDKSGGLERTVTPALILSLLGILFFVSQKMDITGFAISSISDSFSNIGILVCVIGAIILYLCRSRCK